MGKHTPELLEIGLGMRSIHVIAGDRKYVIGGDEQAVKIAERMIATWNACTGIPNEALKEGAVKELVEALNWAMPILRAFFDDPHVSRIMDKLNIVPGPDYDKARAVLASFKEEIKDV